MPFFARVEYALVGIESRVSRQQGRVDVQNPPGVVLYEPRAENAHETGKHQQLGLHLVESRGNGAIERFTVLETTVLDAGGRYARGPGSLQAESIGSVAEHETEVQIDFAGCRGIDEGLQVGA